MTSCPAETAAERAGLQHPPGSFTLSQPLPLHAQLRLQHRGGGAAPHGSVRPQRAAHDQVGPQRCRTGPAARPLLVAGCLSCHSMQRLQSCPHFAGQPLPLHTPLPILKPPATHPVQPSCLPSLARAGASHWGKRSMSLPAGLSLPEREGLLAACKALQSHPVGLPVAFPAWCGACPTCCGPSGVCCGMLPCADLPAAGKCRLSPCQTPVRAAWPHARDW